MSTTNLGSNDASVKDVALTLEPVVISVSNVDGPKEVLREPLASGSRRLSLR